METIALSDHSVCNRIDAQHAILATAAGMRGYAGFATWAATAPPEVLTRLGMRLRRPSEKTFRAVFSRLDPADLDRRFGASPSTRTAAPSVRAPRHRSSPACVTPRSTCIASAAPTTSPKPAD